MAAVTRRARGQALVEFVLVTPLFLLLIVGVMALGVVVRTDGAVSAIATEAARAAALASTPAAAVTAGPSILVMSSAVRRKSSLSKNAGARTTKSRSKPGVWSRKASTYMSAWRPSKTTIAPSRGVPRLHSLTTRGYPDSVIEPGPKSVAT